MMMAIGGVLELELPGCVARVGGSGVGEKKGGSIEADSGGSTVSSKVPEMTAQ